ncbi:MAG: hypothetical protein AAFO91_17275 [Bacteroidota bacterium]
MTTKKTTKKAAKKTIAKKTATKQAPKRTTKKVNKRYPTYVNLHNAFWTCDGRVICSLYELEASYRYMIDEVYQHHVGGDQNDFALWVELILEDPECATDLRKAKTASKASAVVVKHLKKYRL